MKTTIRDLAQACIATGLFEGQIDAAGLLNEVRNDVDLRNNEPLALRAMLALSVQTADIAKRAEHGDEKAAATCKWFGVAKHLIQAVSLAVTPVEVEALTDRAREMVEYLTTPTSFAAVGNDGQRPVVWGIGDTESEARADATENLRDVDCEDDVDDLRIVPITPDRRSKIEAGDVDASDL
jgi:hypothetical protein